MKRHEITTGHSYWLITKARWVRVAVKSGNGTIWVEDGLSTRYWVHPTELRADEPHRSQRARAKEEPKTKLQQLAEDWPAKRATLWPEVYPHGLTSRQAQRKVRA